MGVDIILQLIATIMPYAMKAGVDLVSSIERMNSGESVEDLIAELKAKRDDLTELPFK